MSGQAGGRPRGEAPADKPEIWMERHINASRERVYDAWGDPEAFAAWMGPNGFTITMKEMDFVVGGFCRFTMHAPNGVNFENRLRYRELRRPSRIAYTHDSGIDNDPDGFEVTVDLIEQGGGALVKIRSVFPSLERREVVKGFGAIELGQQTWDKLAAWAESRSL